MARRSTGRLVGPSVGCAAGSLSGWRGQTEGTADPPIFTPGQKPSEVVAARNVKPLTEQADMLVYIVQIQEGGGAQR